MGPGTSDSTAKPDGTAGWRASALGSVSQGEWGGTSLEALASSTGLSQ